VPEVPQPARARHGRVAASDGRAAAHLDPTDEPVHVSDVQPVGHEPPHPSIGVGQEGHASVQNRRAGRNAVASLSRHNGAPEPTICCALVNPLGVEVAAHAS
jgi:hypothetical protein